MKAQHSLIFIFLLSMISVQANASIWETISSFFGGSKESDTVAEVSTDGGQALVQTGLQLLPLLTQQLGVTDNQAQGGMGSLLQAAKSLMAGTDYAKMSQMIPGADALLAAAPLLSSESKEESSLASGLMTMAADKSDTLRTGMQLVSQFESLGMGAEMIPKFTEVAQGFLQQSDDPSTGDLLTTALSKVI